MHNLAIYGGTFDPVHKAHISTASKIQDFFHFDAFYFLPCKDPLIKPPSRASAKQRCAMLELAIEDYPEFQSDLREVKRASPSYMAETLQSYRTENPFAAITLIIGQDAFLSLPKWYAWQKLMGLANILVMERPGENLAKALPQELQLLLDKHQTFHYEDILHSPFGKIIRFNAGNFDLSSTAIRKKIASGESVEADLSARVLAYIKNFGLYQ